MLAIPYQSTIYLKRVTCAAAASDLRPSRMLAIPYQSTLYLKRVTCAAAASDVPSGAATAMVVPTPHREASGTVPPRKSGSWQTLVSAA